MSKEEKYGVADLAKHMGVEAATARVKLRNAGIKKVEGRYSWGSKPELAKVAAKCEAASPAPKATKKKSKKKAKPAKRARKAKADEGAGASA